MTILVATGLKREARIIRKAGIIVIAGGGDGARLESELQCAIARSQANGCPVRAILSSGLAGGLTPSLRPGDIVIGSDSDPRLRVALELACPGAISGPMAGSDTIVATAKRKRSFANRTGALTIDMESHIAQRVAAQHHIPFAAIRAISDSADDDLPPAALVGMGANGGIAIGSVLASLARNPGQLPALLRTSWNAERGFRALLRCHRAGRLVDLVDHALDMP